MLMRFDALLYNLFLKEAPTAYRTRARTTDSTTLRLVRRAAAGASTVWDMERGGKPVLQFKGHDDGITSVQSDSSKVVTAGLDNTVRVWDSSTGKQLYRLNGEATDAISARFEGPWLVWNGLSRNVLLMDYSYSG